jgi:hypothetical protein
MLINGIWYECGSHARAPSRGTAKWGATWPRSRLKSVPDAGSPDRICPLQCSRRGLRSGGSRRCWQTARGVSDRSLIQPSTYPSRSYVAEWSFTLMFSRSAGLASAGKCPARSGALSHGPTRRVKDYAQRSLVLGFYAGAGGKAPLFGWDAACALAFCAVGLPRFCRRRRARVANLEIPSSIHLVVFLTGGCNS